LREEDPEIDVYDAHIIATTFERYIKDTMLNVAVEYFSYRGRTLCLGNR
jgi:hypothetical protein